MNVSTTFEDLLDTKKKKLDFFQNLILVAIADRYVDEKESDFLVSIGNQLNLTSQDTDPLVENLSSLSFIIPEDGLQKHMELQTLVMMVLQDGKVEEREYDLCLKYTQQVGFSPEILDQLIRKMSK